jgi:hypothetical protein
MCITWQYIRKDSFGTCCLLLSSTYKSDIAVILVEMFHIVMHADFINNMYHMLPVASYFSVNPA